MPPSAMPAPAVGDDYDVDALRVAFLAAFREFYAQRTGGLPPSFGGGTRAESWIKRVAPFDLWHHVMARARPAAPRPA